MAVLMPALRTAGINLPLCRQWNYQRLDSFAAVMEMSRRLTAGIRNWDGIHEN